MVNRRDFLETSAMTMAAVIASKNGILPKHADAKSLSEIIVNSESDVFYRNRLPDYQTPLDNPVFGKDVNLFDWNFTELVTSATEGKFGESGMPANFSTYNAIPEGYIGMPVAIIGAGSAGLATGYELMKLGLKPVYFEMQTETISDGTVFARPFGRIYSWDYGGKNIIEGAGAGWFPQDILTPITAMPNTHNTHAWGRRVVELGGMRFPATHLTLRTYTDSVFRGDYYFGKPYPSPWTPFRDPGLYKTTNTPNSDRGGVVSPNDNDTIIYDTVYHTKGIFKTRSSENPPTKGGYSERDVVKAGTTLKESNAAVYNLTYKYFDLLFGDTNSSNPYVGILTPILEFYSQYSKNPSQDLSYKIAQEWQVLLRKYDKMSLREVLIEAGWQDSPAYGDNKWGEQGLSLLEMFGEIGTGTGPFAMFYYSSFMELLRIALQAADSNQDYFLGGAGYQLQPFLTHFTPTRSDEPTCLWNETYKSVITDKVIAVEADDTGGIKITTEDAQNVQKSYTFTAAVVTAGPAAMRATNLFPTPDHLIPSRAVSYIKRVRINNNSKVAINFPNLPNQPYSRAFWMNRTMDNPDDPINDLIVTTLTDKTIRQIYTFDNYHWATVVTEGRTNTLLGSGTLMLNYGWDYNAQSWTADNDVDAVRKAWRQMDDIYEFEGMYDQYLEWAIEHKQYSVIVWEKIDGFNAAWRMAQPGRATIYGDPNADKRDQFSEFQSMQTFGMTSYNFNTDKYTGLFIAGEASASPGLSGWVEGSIQTGLQSVAGIVKYLNSKAPTPLHPNMPEGSSFALHAHPGRTPLDT
ncbi:MAG: FAD-dependent oxidoreductase [Parvularculales bacterium]